MSMAKFQPVGGKFRSQSVRDKTQVTDSEKVNVVKSEGGLKIGTKIRSGSGARTSPRRKLSSIVRELDVFFRRNMGSTPLSGRSGGLRRKLFCRWRQNNLVRYWVSSGGGQE